MIWPRISRRGALAQLNHLAECSFFQLCNCCSVARDRSRRRICVDFLRLGDCLPPELVCASSSYAHDAPSQTEHDERKYQDGNQSVPREDFLDVAYLPR